MMYWNMVYYDTYLLSKLLTSCVNLHWMHWHFPPIFQGYHNNQTTTRDCSTFVHQFSCFGDHYSQNTNFCLEKVCYTDNYYTPWRPLLEVAWAPSAEVVFSPKYQNSNRTMQLANDGMKALPDFFYLTKVEVSLNQWIQWIA